MNIISKFMADNIESAILEDLKANPGWQCESMIHQRICGGGVWEHFPETFSALVKLKEEGKIKSSGNNGFNSFAFKLA
jgi:hypothetical protein